jgi:uncharacterized protein involved in cysteine biosynthesis
MKLFALIMSIALLNGCAFYPQQVEHYDSRCKIHYKQLVLKQSGFGMRIEHCENEGCIAALLSIPVQALVAGSVVIAGNTVYWLEKEGECLLKDDGE